MASSYPSFPTDAILYLFRASLGGLSPVYTSCAPGGWGFYSIENVACALLEGFADFFAAVVGGSATGVHQVLVADGLPNVDGYRIPGSFAGFLYDVVDATNTEYYDAVTLTAAYVGDRLKRCQQKTSTHAQYYLRAAGTDVLAYCLESNYTTSFWLNVPYSDLIEVVAPNTQIPSPPPATQAALRVLAKKHLRGVD